MQWDSSLNAGFTVGTQWLAVNPNYAKINARAAQTTPGSIFSYYQRLIQLRHRLPIITTGDYQLRLPDDPAV
ncbi:alpha-glucosidase [Lactiplantibacillus plantarum]|nr:alpha-glucosidase [Lactiplantibacillus plantarum]